MAREANSIEGIRDGTLFVDAASSLGHQAFIEERVHGIRRLGGPSLLTMANREGGRPWDCKLLGPRNSGMATRLSAS